MMKSVLKHVLGLETKFNNFFITGCARSGTTCIAKILDTATNAKVTVEAPPVLHIETRALYDGVLEEPYKVFYKAKTPMMRHWNCQFMIYGDKNVNYVVWLPYIREKIVFVVRDGRDVVRSLMNWHTHWKDIYCEADRKVWDLNDYSRPRPKPNSKYYDLWHGFSRFEMCCWYWMEWNRLAYEYLKARKRDSYMVLNMNQTCVDEVREIFEWLGLEGFDEKHVEKLLFGRINSLKERFGKEDRFPSYEAWDDGTKEMFWNICGEMMHKLGYT